ncbi:helix-turn-helix transcriptional regulator [Rhodanobacter sp. Col0626]|uniref:helix-turn-helix transcriptional regulator n=1 Tax=Rhodanobacter sp. Col0626 TaxID=3415679 RepID=UPI003CEB24F1
MKQSIASPLATRQHPRLSPHESDRAHIETQSSPHSGVTLGDVHRKLVELLNELARRKASKKAIRLPDVQELTGEGRSQIYARMNPKYAAYDETWPVPFYIGKSPRWWEHDVAAWLEAKAASSTATRH